MVKPMVHGAFSETINAIGAARPFFDTQATCTRLGPGFRMVS